MHGQSKRSLVGWGEVIWVMGVFRSKQSTLTNSFKMLKRFFVLPTLNLLSSEGTCSILGVDSTGFFSERFLLQQSLRISGVCINNPSQTNPIVWGVV